MKRYIVLDLIRGLTLVSMILYHMVWDLVYIFDKKLPWYPSLFGYIWQQSICFVFILLSGFCWSLGRKKWKHAAVVFGCGVLITFVTSLVMPEDRVFFGVLTFLGTAAFLLNVLEPILKKWKGTAGLLGSLLFFAATKEVNRGFFGYGTIRLFHAPEIWYQNLFTAYLGFPPKGFYSSDYFSIFPWIFLYFAGYYLFSLMESHNAFSSLEKSICVPLEWMGRHSLILYMLHQPLLYGILFAIL